MPKFFDLTGPLMPGMWHYGGPFPAFQSELIADIPTHGYRATALHISTHMGTHCDTPKHYWADAPAADELDLDQFFGRARVLRLPEFGKSLAAIDIPDLEQAGAGAVEKGDILLLATGWDRHWHQSFYSNETPHLTNRATYWLVEKGIKLLGTDTALCCDPRVGETSIAPGTEIPDHILLKNGIVYVNGLVDVMKLPADVVNFAAFPLKVVGGDGAPMRAVAWI